MRKKPAASIVYLDVGYGCIFIYFICGKMLHSDETMSWLFNWVNMLMLMRFIVSFRWHTKFERIVTLLPNVRMKVQKMTQKKCSSSRSVMHRITVRRIICTIMMLCRLQFLTQYFCSASKMVEWRMPSPNAKKSAIVNKTRATSEKAAQESSRNELRCIF